jgi:hypothetical protein
MKEDSLVILKYHEQTTLIDKFNLLSHLYQEDEADFISFLQGLR